MKNSTADNSNAEDFNANASIINDFFRDYLHNRAMLIFPDKPVYVQRVAMDIQPEIEDILKSSHGNSEDKSTHFFCLYHLMLENLKYTRQVVVDITDNSLQSLFWLGAAHGSSIDAISVKWRKTDDELQATVNDAEKRKAYDDVEYLQRPERSIVDVAGLWTAILETGSIEVFYRQLTLAQMDIELHSKLMLNSEMKTAWDNRSDNTKKDDSQSLWKK